MNKKIYLFVMIIVFSKMLFAIEDKIEDKSDFFWKGGMKSLIATKNTFSITISDQVTGGCLPRPSELKNKMEISLRRNGFKIVDYEKNPMNNIYITAIGYKITDSSCAVHLSTELSMATAVNVPYAEKNNELTVTYVNYSLGSNILTGDRYSMQKRLEKIVSESADSLYLNVSRAKDYIFEKFPAIEVNYKNNTP